MQTDRDRLRQHVAQLASIPRPAESESLEIARQYVTGQLIASGWEVARHLFQAAADVVSFAGINLIARHSRHPVAAGPRICVGAHLDSRPESPGADDNASAVAALLEIARLLPERWPAHPVCEIELVLFDLEENGMLGGAEHARLARLNQTDLRGMVALEMLGYCSQAPGSQSLPRALVGLYPSVGNFIAVVGNQNSGELMQAFRTGMRKVEGLPVELLQVPNNGDYLQATRLSDHSPFWDAGFSALMITDTAFMRNPHYHQATDTVETLDFEFLQRVTEGSLEAVIHLLAEGLPGTETR